MISDGILIQVKGASMWARLGGVHVAGWVLSILSTAAIAKASQVWIKLFRIFTH